MMGENATTPGSPEVATDNFILDGASDCDDSSDMSLQRIREYIEGWPLKVVTSEAKGRHLIATREVLQGELLLQALPYAISISESNKKRVCDYCYRFNLGGRLEVSCYDCRRSFYCDDVCRERHFPSHRRFMCKLQAKMKSWKVDQDMMSFLQLVGNIAIRRRVETTDGVQPTDHLDTACAPNGGDEAPVYNEDKSHSRPCYSDCFTKQWRAKEYGAILSSNEGEQDVDIVDSEMGKNPKNELVECSSEQRNDSRRGKSDESRMAAEQGSATSEAPGDADEETSQPAETVATIYEPARCYCHDFLPYIPQSEILSEQKLGVVSEEEKKREETKLLARGLGLKSRTVSLLQSPRKDITPLSHERKVSFALDPEHKPRDTDRTAEPKNAVRIAGASSSSLGGLFAAIADMSVSTESANGSDLQHTEAIADLDDSGIEDASVDGLPNVLETKWRSECVEEYSGAGQVRRAEPAEDVIETLTDRIGNKSKAANGSMSMQARVEQHIREVQGQRVVPTISFDSATQDSQIPNGGTGSGECATSEAKVMPSILKQKKQRSVSYSAHSTNKPDSGEGSAEERPKEMCIRDSSRDYVRVRMGVVVAPEARDFQLLESHHDTYDKDRLKDLRKPLQQLMSAINPILESNMHTPAPTCPSGKIEEEHETPSSHLPAYNTTTKGTLEPVSFDELLTIAGRVESNCFGYRNRKNSVHTQLGRLVVPMASYFNHSCRPNITAEFADSNLASFVAKRVIRNGQEVCISYIDENLPRSERQYRLKDSYLFQCECAKCTELEGQTGNPSWSKSMNKYAKPPSHQPKKNNKAINKSTNKKRKSIKKGRQRQFE